MLMDYLSGIQGVLLMCELPRRFRQERMCLDYV
jgi:hypothetical protein